MRITSNFTSRVARRHLAAAMLAAGLSIAAVPAAHAGVVVDFNGGALNFSSNFSQNHDNTPTTDIKFGATSGVQDQPGPSAGGGLTATGALIDTTVVYTPTKWTVTDGLTHTVSTFVTAVSGLGVGDKHLQIGFLNGTSSSFNGENPPNAGFPNLQPMAFISARLLGDNELEFQSKDIGGGAVATTPRVVPTGTITAGDFLKVTFSETETNAATGAFNWSLTLEDYGPTGTAAPVLNASSSGSVTVAGLANQDLFAGFRTATPTGFTGTINFDNFVVTGNGVAVPEPATFGLMLVGGVGLLARRRRR